MSAKVTLVSGDDVYIERSDRLRTKLSINIFCESDQKYIRDWATKEALKNGAFEIRFTKEESDKNKSEGEGIITTSYNAWYEIVLKNTTQQAIKDLRVEYICFKFTDKVAAIKRSEGEFERINGEVLFESLAARSEEKRPTKNFKMKETGLMDGWVWSGDARKSRESKDKLEGIWVKIYAGNSLVLETARPESLMRNEVW